MLSTRFGGGMQDCCFTPCMGGGAGCGDAAAPRTACPTCVVLQLCAFLGRGTRGRGMQDALVSGSESLALCD